MTCSLLHVVFQPPALADSTSAGEKCIYILELSPPVSPEETAIEGEVSIEWGVTPSAPAVLNTLDDGKYSCADATLRLETAHFQMSVDLTRPESEEDSEAIFFPGTMQHVELGTINPVVIAWPDEDS